MPTTAVVSTIGKADLITGLSLWELRDAQLSTPPLEKSSKGRNKDWTPPEEQEKVIPGRPRGGSSCGSK